MKYVELFSGAGGMSYGFEKAGFENVFSVEFDHKIAETYRKNFPDNHLIVEDVKKISNEMILNLLGDVKVDVVIGGPPCQGFSLAGKNGRTFVDDERNYLFKEFVRFVSVIQPRAFVMENVARLKSHNKGHTIQEIEKEFKNLGYTVKNEILQAAEYNVPQKRQRIFIVGVKTGVFDFPQPQEKILTVKDALDDLPELLSGQSSNVPNHIAMNHSDQMLEKMSYVTDGGDRFDIPEHLRPISGDIRKYIRYSSNEPSITITGDMRKVFHYNQNRALTCRELARLQSFPDNFVFEGNSISIQQQIGNAVPPNLGFAVAKEVKRALSSVYDKETISKEVSFPKVNYIGNKEKLSKWIVQNFPIQNGKVLDLFAGGHSFSFELKKSGFSVVSNDVLYASFVIGKAIIENKKVKLDKSHIEKAQNYTLTKKERNEFAWLENKLYFPEEVEELAKLVKYSKTLKSYEKYMFQSLIRRAMIRKLPYSRMNIPWNNIVKLRDEEYSYERYGRKRAYHNETFSSHMIKNIDSYNAAVFDNFNENKIFQKDAISMLDTIEFVDVIYMDPPYPGTMNKYDDFYGFFDKVFEKEKKFIDLTDKNTFVYNLEKIIKKSKSKSKYIVMSLNSNTVPSAEEICKLFLKYGTVSIKEKKHNYQISGKENKNNNHEILMILKLDKNK